MGDSHSQGTIRSLIGINATRQTIQFDEAHLTALRVGQSGHDDQGDGNAANILWRMVSGNGTRSRTSGSVASVSKDRNRISGRKDFGIRSLKLSDLRRGCIVHNVLDVGNHIIGGVEVTYRIVPSYLRNGSAFEGIGGGIQLIADPINRAVGDVRSDVGFDDQIKFVGRGAIVPHTYGTGGAGGVAGAPGERGAGEEVGVCRVSRDERAGRGKTSIVDVADHLIHSEAGFLEGIQKLRIGLKTFLRASEEGESSSANHQENTERDDQLDDGKTGLSGLSEDVLHRSTMVSSVTGWK